MQRVSTFVSLAIFLAMSGITCVHAAELQLNPGVPVITTRGDAQVEVQPDTFTIVAEVQTYNKDLNLAYSANDDAAAAVLAVAKKYKIKDDSVQTSNINVSTEFSSSSRHSVRSHYVRRSISLKIRDGSQIRQLLADVIAAGASSISSVTYNSSEIRKHKDAARLMALKAAKEKAELLSGALGNKIGKAICIEEDLEPVSPYAPNNRQMNMFQVEPMVLEGNSYGVALGTIPIKASIRATFELQ